jgi:hypothetical protein
VCQTFSTGAAAARRGAGRLAPGPRARHLVRHRHAHPHAEPGAHAAAARRVGRRRAHRLGGGILLVGGEVADHPHLGALVEGRLHRLRQRDVLDVEARQLEPVFGDPRRDALGDDLGEVDGVRRHVEHRDAARRDDLARSG